jgi:hypothetical protein
VRWSFVAGDCLALHIINAAWTSIRGNQTGPLEVRIAAFLAGTENPYGRSVRV